MTPICPMFIPALILASTAMNQAYAADTCRTGFVWREAYPGDVVCVDPIVREQAAADNQAAASRRQPGGGKYGPDTCRPGFVWREARPEDRVCVTPDTRTRAANDNRLASERVALNVSLLARVAGSQAMLPRPAGPATKRGFDDDGNAFVEEVLPDGSRRRTQRGKIIETKPNGATKEITPMGVRSHVQAPTPPQLPSSGMEWVNYHNQQLLDLISLMVNNDASQMALFHRGENKQVGPDPFEQIGYRMRVLDDLAKP